MERKPDSEFKKRPEIDTDVLRELVDEKRDIDSRAEMLKKEALLWNGKIEKLFEKKPGEGVTIMEMMDAFARNGR